ncbi:clpP2 [Symbiodinium sp. CCMP2592]|nr:clpP2 [Symbiodinium sp. CCMP2592]
MAWRLQAGEVVSLSAVPGVEKLSRSQHRVALYPRARSPVDLVPLWAFASMPEVWLNVCCIDRPKMKIFRMPGMHPSRHACGLESSPSESTGSQTTDCPADTWSIETCSPAYSHNAENWSRSEVRHPAGYPVPPGWDFVGDAGPALQQESGMGRQPNRTCIVSGPAAPACTDVTTVTNDVFAGFAGKGLAAEVHGFGASTAQQMPAPASFGTSHDDVSLQKRINKDLTTAAKSEDEDPVSEVLRVAAVHLHHLNSVNLSTAVHRLARACEGSKAKANRVKTDPIFLLMLEVAEHKAQLELHGQADSMPSNCCTIVTWSCAVLRFFRPSLFTVLARVAARDLQECQCYELTNLLWSFAELCKRQPTMAEDMGDTIQELVQAAASSFLHRRPKAWTIKVLVSAVVSLTYIPCKDFCAKWFIISLVQELAERSEEAQDTNLVPVVVAFDTLRTRHLQVFRDICNAMSRQHPDFVMRYMYGGARQNRNAKQHTKRPKGQGAHAYGNSLHVLAPALLTCCPSFCRMESGCLSAPCIFR